jgi:8-oxo-dGTP diphosphatase
VPRALFERLPRGALPILREIVRVLLKRPVVGIVAVARRDDGQVLLVRRGDTGTWALPGGTLEWGETARVTLERELAEEAGATLREAGALRAVYSAPERDARMHAVTIVVACTVEGALRGPKNPLEIFDARFFPVDALPADFAYTLDEMLERALRESAPFWE